MTPNNQKVIDGQPAPTSPGLSFLPGTILPREKTKRTHTLESLVSFNEGRVLAHPNSGSSVQGTSWHFAIPPFATLVVDQDPDAAWARLLVLFQHHKLARIQAAGLPGPGPGPKEARPQCDFGCLSGRAAQGTGSSHSCVLSFNRDPTVRHSFGVHPKPDTPDCQLRYGKTRTRGPKKKKQKTSTIATTTMNSILPD